MISGLNSTGHEIGGTIGIADLLDDRSRSGRSSAARRPPRRSRTPSWQPGSSTSLASMIAFAVLPHARTSCRSSASTPPRCPFTEMAKQTTPAKTQRRRRSDADRSVQAILEAALEALASDPDASMAEIARRAGVVRATIYAHFPTREALLDAVMEHAVAQVAEATAAAEPDARRAEGSAGAGAPRHLAGSSASSTPCSRSTPRGSRRRNCTAATCR